MPLQQAHKPSSELSGHPLPMHRAMNAKLIGGGEAEHSSQVPMPVLHIQVRIRQQLVPAYGTGCDHGGRTASKHTECGDGANNCCESGW